MIFLGHFGFCRAGVFLVVVSPLPSCDLGSINFSLQSVWFCSFFFLFGSFVPPLDFSFV